MNRRWRYSVYLSKEAAITGFFTLLVITTSYLVWSAQELPSDRVALRVLADQGSYDAQMALGTLYQQTNGNAADAAEGYFWLSLAQQSRRQQGLPEWQKLRRAIGECAARLTPAQREAEDERIRQWTPAGK